MNGAFLYSNYFILPSGCCASGYCRSDARNGAGRDEYADDDRDNDHYAEERSRVISLVDVAGADRVANEEDESDDRNSVKDVKSEIFPRGHGLKIVWYVWVSHDALLFVFYLHVCAFII